MFLEHQFLTLLLIVYICSSYILLRHDAVQTDQNRRTGIIYVQTDQNRRTGIIYAKKVAFRNQKVLCYKSGIIDWCPFLQKNNVKPASNVKLK